MTDNIRPNVIDGIIDDLGSAEVTEETVLGRWTMEANNDNDRLLAAFAELVVRDIPCPDFLGAF